MLHRVSVTLTIIYGLHLTQLSECMRKNVCKTLEDYRTIQHNPNCWYNPDVGASPNKIAKRHGYPFESYEITTEDGYIVNLFRIPHNGSDIGWKRPPVFLQHGFAHDASAWMALGAESIVFILSDNGYDVWMANSRGAKYSTKHVKYTVNDPEYWNFSFHESALYDVPAMLDFITSKTNQKRQITYIGNSMGSTMSFVYTSLRPKHAKANLRAVISVAPVVYLDNIGPLLKAIAAFRLQIWDLLTSLGIYGVGPNLQYTLDLLHDLCTQYPFIIICVNIYEIVTGKNGNELRKDAFPVFSRTFPSGFSLKTLAHYAQIVDAEHRFQMFDYGPDLNMRFYNSTLPPEYPIFNIKVPVHLFYGKGDTVATEKDVLALYDKLDTEKTIMEVFGFSHFNFLSGKRAVDFYRILLNYLGID